MEWLRIVCMLLIVAHHFGGHGVYPDSILPINEFIRVALTTGGKLGVNCFVLITGYFLLRSHFGWRKVFKLVATVWVYSVVIYLTISLVEGNFDPILCAKAFFPIIYKQYWFMTAYLIAYILSPFVAILVRASTQKQHLLLMALLFVLACLLGMLPQVSLVSEVGWFIFLLLVGSYLYRYPNFVTRIKPLYAFLVWLGIYALIVVVQYWGHYSMQGMTHPVCLAWSLALFAIFANAKIPNSKVVNRLAAGTLGVYLIHDNNYIRPRLWNSWLMVGWHSEQGYFIAFALLSIAAVWVACTLIDTARQLAFDLIEKGAVAIWRRLHPIEIPQEPEDLPAEAETVEKGI